MFKDFMKNGKKYIDYLMGLDFVELFVNVVEIIILILLASLVYLPIGLIQDLLYELLVAVVGVSETFFKWYTILFRFGTGVIAIIVFIYLFNRRYAKLDKLIEKDPMRDRKNKQKEETTEKKEETTKEKSEDNSKIDLPKKKD